MLYALRSLRFTLGTFHALFVFGLLAFQVGCRNENRFQQLRLSTVEDSPNLSELKTQASFRAELVDINIHVETNVLWEGPASGASNSYQFVLRDQRGRERVFAGINASENDLQALNKLQKTNTYTFPDVLEGRSK